MKVRWFKVRRKTD